VADVDVILVGMPAMSAEFWYELQIAAYVWTCSVLMPSFCSSASVSQLERGIQAYQLVRDVLELIIS
jgi:hypothetical protein